MSERDICIKFITPALEKSDWDKLVLDEVSFTDVKIYVQGKMTARGAKKRVHYILFAAAGLRSHLLRSLLFSPIYLPKA